MHRELERMKLTIRQLVTNRYDGFSLMEISIVLLVIGIIAGGMLKGKDLIEAVQVRAVVNDFQNLQTAFESYVNSYGSIPGDDASASDRFPGVSNGDGNGVVSSDDATKIFEHLFSAGLIETKKFKIPKIGGEYDVISEDNCVKLRLSNDGNPALSKKQTIAIIAKANEVFGQNSDLIETEPQISSNASQKYLVKFTLR